MFALFELGAAGPESEAPLPPLLAIVAGAVLAVGVVIPGISSSFLLIYMGMYASVLTAIASVDIPMLFFAGVGFLAMGFGIIKLVNWMLKKHRALSYFAFIGFVAGSVALVVPRVIEGLSWTSPFLFVIGLAVSVFQGFLKARKVGLSADLGMIPELGAQKNAAEGGEPDGGDAPDPDGAPR
jgi:putative membrane protein